eukprot:240228-Rhodomonas_salina.2
MDGWEVGWMDGRMDGRMGGWILFFALTWTAELSQNSLAAPVMNHRSPPPKKKLDEAHQTKSFPHSWYTCTEIGACFNGNLGKRAAGSEPGAGGLLPHAPPRAPRTQDSPSLPAPGKGKGGDKDGDGGASTAAGGCSPLCAYACPMPCPCYAVPGMTLPRIYLRSCYTMPGTDEAYDTTACLPAYLLRDARY